MRFCRIGWLLLALLMGSPTWGAESDSKSVYSISPYTDGAVILAGALGTVIPYATFPVNRRCPCDPNEVNAFDRSAIGNNSAFARGLSDVLVGAAVIAPLALDCLDVGLGPTLLEDTVVFLQVLAVNSALVTLTKYAFQRPIPLAYSGHLAGVDEGYRGFYSGHTSTAFAALMAVSVTLSLRYHLGAPIWLGSAALGATVGAARVAGGNHFPTDVIVGALVGAAVGVLIPWWHRHQPKSQRVILAPTNGGEGLQLVWVRSLG